jgi:hypothetical protein
VIEISNSDAFVCLRQRGSADGSEPRPRRNRRTSIGKSSLAQKWNSQRRAMAIQFQALHFSLYGPEFRHEACHRKLNLELIVDAMRRVLNKEDKEEFREFVNDVNAENNVPNQLDGMRYKSAQVHKSLQMSLQKWFLSTLEHVLFTKFCKSTLLMP